MRGPGVEVAVRDRLGYVAAMNRSWSTWQTPHSGIASPSPSGAAELPGGESRVEGRGGVWQAGPMRVTFLGHVGMYIETEGGSILCDPWFTPAYFGSWFPFPRNDTLDVAPFTAPDYLYISHLHHDHFDPEWLRRMSTSGRRCCCRLPVDHLERALRDLGFSEFVRTDHAEPVRPVGSRSRSSR